MFVCVYSYGVEDEAGMQPGRLRAGYNKDSNAKLGKCHVREIDRVADISGRWGRGSVSSAGCGRSE